MDSYTQELVLSGIKLILKTFTADSMPTVDISVLLKVLLIGLKLKQVNIVSHC